MNHLYARDARHESPSRSTARRRALRAFSPRRGDGDFLLFALFIVTRIRRTAPCRLSEHFTSLLRVLAGLFASGRLFASSSSARHAKLLNTEVIIIHALHDVPLKLLIRDVHLLERLLVVRRLERFRLDDAEHILHHRVRLQLRPESLIHANQTIFIVNVKPTLFPIVLGVSYVQGDALGETSRPVLGERVVLTREMLDRTPRGDARPAKREDASRAQVQNFHIRAQTVILRHVYRRLLALARLLEHGPASAPLVLVRNRADETNVILETREIELGRVA